ncbi:MAG TPA: cytochrome C biogenesis protein [Allosphingosinicella sp.]|jgi:cytochrome c-type biogenesis protein CcmH/NrfG
MGWIVAFALAAAALAALWRLGRLDRGGLQLVAAALLLGLAGYAWQGRPALRGSPKSAAQRQPLPETGFMLLRRELLGRFDTADRWLSISEGFHRRGDSREAAGVIRSAIRAHPRNYQLWIGYGTELLVHGRGMTPAAQLAFQRAGELAPGHPAPPFFFAAALAETGDLDTAEAIWRTLLARPSTSPAWRAALQRQVALVDRARAIAAAQAEQQRRRP